MAISLVQTTVGTTLISAATLDLTAWGSNTTTGNLIVVAVGTSNAGFVTVTSISDSQLNTYTKIDAGAQTVDGELWYAQNITGGTTPTITLHLGASTGFAVNAIAREYSGIAAVALDKHISAANLSTNPSSGATAATTSANELVIGWLSMNATLGLTVGAGYGNFTTEVGSTTFTVALEDKTVSSTGAQTATFTNANTTGWVCGVATFIAATTPAPFGKLFGTETSPSSTTLQAVNRACRY